MNEQNKHAALTIAQQYPPAQYNLLVPMQTVTEIADIQKPVMNSVKISTDLNDGEIYEMEKAKDEWRDNRGNIHRATPQHRKADSLRRLPQQGRQARGPNQRPAAHRRERHHRRPQGNCRGRRDGRDDREAAGRIYEVPQRDVREQGPQPRPPHRDAD